MLGRTNFFLIASYQYLDYLSIINKEVNEFKVQAYVDNGFKEVSKADILGKWSVFFFYPADGKRTRIKDKIQTAKAAGTETSIALLTSRNNK